jgi:hypothetical protein
VEWPSELVKLGKSGSEVQFYGDNALKKIGIYKWVTRFSEGRENATDEKRSGGPATSITEENIAKVRQILRENRRLTVRSIAEQANIDRETIRKTLTEDEEGVCKSGPKGAHRRTLSVRESLASKQTTVLEHPPYLPYLVPSDFLLFPKVKEILKGRHFDDVDDSMNNMMAALKDISQKHFQNCFEGWTRRWHWCIASQGD